MSQDKIIQAAFNQLLGTWVGSNGLNVISVPSKDTFLLKVAEINETITFTPITGPVPNRGSNELQNIIGVKYEIVISDRTTNENLHIENGMWLYTPLVDASSGKNTLVRQAAIPHGNVLSAGGTFVHVNGPPTFLLSSSFPEFSSNVGVPLDYTQQFQNIQRTLKPGQNLSNLNELLQTDLKNIEVNDFVFFDVTANQSEIVNIPFIQSNANVTSFNAQFWIENAVDKLTNTPLKLLQYNQTIILDFLKDPTDPSGTKLIRWPHINVNTLVKQ